MSSKCRHILTTGRRCGSPALRETPYCFFHAKARKRHQFPPAPVRTETIDSVFHPDRPETVQYTHPDRNVPHPTPALLFDFPVLEDRESIQVAASMIVAALGRNQLDPRRAASILYGLQVATAVTDRDNNGVRIPYVVVTEAITTSDGGDLAPEDPPPPPSKEKHLR